MRIFKQKGCKTWRVRFSVDRQAYDIALGTRILEVAHQRARKLVREKQQEAAGILAPKIQRDVAQKPLLELLDIWVTTGLAPDVGRKHRTYCKNRPARVFEECTWERVSDVNAKGFEEWRAKQHRQGAKAKTLNEYLGHLRSFFGWLEEREMIGVNPLKSVKLLRIEKEDSQRAFTMNELSQLIAAVPRYRACLYRIAAFTGLRKAELKALTWSRITLDGVKPLIELEPSKTKNRKGGTLPLHPEALEAFQELRSLCPEEATFVFFKGVTQMPRFYKDLALAGIEAEDNRGRGLVFHSFRRTWATILNSSGIAPRVAMELMRHSDLRLTMSTYNDSNMLPLMRELEKVPSLKSSLKSSLKTGKSCPNVSTAGKINNSLTAKKAPENQGFRVEMASVDQACPNAEMADREGFEPSIPFWSILP